MDNPVRRQIKRIYELSSKHPKKGRRMEIEVKDLCPFCWEFAILLKERGAHYWCMNCNAEGSLDELEQIWLEKLMSEPRGVNL